MCILQIKNPLQQETIDLWDMHLSHGGGVEYLSQMQVKWPPTKMRTNSQFIFTAESLSTRICHTLPYFLRWQTRGKLGGGGGKRGCMPFLCCCTCVSWRSGTRCGTQQSFHLTFLQTSFSIILARTVFKLHSRKPVSFLVPTEEDWCFSTKRGFGCGGI